MRRWDAVIEGLGKGQCVFRCAIHWTQSDCLKQTGVSLGLALIWVCSTGMSLTQSAHW